MTRENIFIMGKTAMQLGIEDPEELAAMARLWVTWGPRAEFAAYSIAEAREGLRRVDLALAAFREAR